MASADDKRLVINSTPRQEVVVYPYVRGASTATKDDAMKTHRVDVTSSVLELNYSKDKSKPSGTFHIILAPTSSWNYVFKPGDWLTIHQSQINLNSRTTLGLICFGNIDRISRTYIVDDDGKKIVRFKIEGRDFGKILEDTLFYYNPYIYENKDSVSNYTQANVGVLQTGTPTTIFRNYFNIYYGSGIITMDKAGNKRKLKELDQVLLPPKLLSIFNQSSAKKFGNIVRLKIGEEILKFDEVDFLPRSGNSTNKSNRELFYPEGFSINVSPDLIANYNVWEVLQTVADLTTNELYTSMEYYPLEDKIFPTIVFRKIPFSYNKSKKTWLYTKLDRINVRNWSLKQEDLGFSDHERVNWLLLNNDTKIPVALSGQEATMKEAVSNTRFNQLKFTLPNGEDFRGVPYIDEVSIQRYGINKYSPTTKYCYVSKLSKDGKDILDKGNNFTIYKKWMEELVSIWADMERYESGTILLKGFSHKEYPGNRTGLRRKYVLQDLISVGHNLYLADKKKLFHIEGFTRTWTAPGSQEIQVTVSRGVYWDRKKEFKFLDQILTDDQAYRTSETKDPSRERRK